MIQDYLSKSHKELNKLLNNLTLNAPKKTLKITKQLMKEEQFENDFEFWCVIIMHQVASMAMLGMMDELKNVIDNAFVKLSTCDDTDIYLDGCLKFGVAYFELSDLKKAIHLFINVINYELTYNSVSLRSAVAHNNLGALYQQYNKNEQAKDYYLNALQILCDNRLSEPDFFVSRYIFIASNIAIIYAELNDKDNCQLYIQRAKTKLKENASPASQLHFAEALISYYYITTEYDAMAQQFDAHIKNLILNKAYIRIPRTIIRYNRYLLAIHHDRSEFISTVRRTLKIIEGHISTHNKRDIHLIVLNYYLEIGDATYVEKHYQQLKTILSRDETAYNKRQLNVIDTRIKITQNQNNHDKAVNKNLMLSQLNKYNQKNRKKLKSMYDRLRLITAIGQQITSTHRIDDIERLVHSELMTIIPIDTFVILVEKKEVLSSTYLYDNNAIQSEFKLHKSNTTSMVIKTFKEKKTIFSGDILNDKRFATTIKMNHHAKEINHSAIYIPLIYNHVAIGVITIQAKQKNAYTKQDIKQLEHISTYLSIALASANRTIELNREIDIYDDITKQLENRNEHLHKLSNIDGLTRVANRRAFDNFFSATIEAGCKKNTPVNLFMLDIDEFKLYNDTYGHVAGDKALIVISEALNKLFKDENMLFARYGGEEFIALTAGETPESALIRGQKMKKIIEHLNIPNEKSNHQKLTVSIGISSVISCSKNCAAYLIKNADDQLYTIKYSGKNSVSQTIFS